jgi:hypothetical protein
MNQAALGFFSTLLGLVVGAAIASRYPQDLQYGWFLVERIRYLSNLLIGSSEVAQDLEMGRAGKVTDRSPSFTGTSGT